MWISEINQGNEFPKSVLLAESRIRRFISEIRYHFWKD